MLYLTLACNGDGEVVITSSPSIRTLDGEPLTTNEVLRARSRKWVLLSDWPHHVAEHYLRLRATQDLHQDSLKYAHSNACLCNKILPQE